jgi:hypothetical protein
MAIRCQRPIHGFKNCCAVRAWMAKGPIRVVDEGWPGCPALEFAGAIGLAAVIAQQKPTVEKSKRNFFVFPQVLLNREKRDGRLKKGKSGRRR